MCTSGHDLYEGHMLSYFLYVCLWPWFIWGPLDFIFFKCVPLVMIYLRTPLFHMLQMCGHDLYEHHFISYASNVHPWFIWPLYFIFFKCAPLDMIYMKAIGCDLHDIQMHRQTVFESTCKLLARPKEICFQKPMIYMKAIFWLWFIWHSNAPANCIWKHQQALSKAQGNLFSKARTDIKRAFI